VFLAKWPVRSTNVTAWKWSIISDPHQPNLPEVAPDFNDSAWEQCDVSSETGPLNTNENAVFRGHVTVSEQDLVAEAVSICFGMIDDEGWVYVNGQQVGESHDWQATPAFDVKTFLHLGENTIAVAVANHAGPGGVNRGVTLQFQEKPELPVWKRSLFNGLAQIIVQSAQQQGEITLTATSPALQPATVKIKTQ
jgi:beta-galactosidase